MIPDDLCVDMTTGARVRTPLSAGPGVSQLTPLSTLQQVLTRSTPSRDAVDDDTALAMVRTAFGLPEMEQWEFRDYDAVKQCLLDGAQYYNPDDPVLPSVKFVRTMAQLSIFATLVSAACDSDDCGKTTLINVAEFISDSDSARVWLNDTSTLRSISDNVVPVSYDPSMKNNMAQIISFATNLLNGDNIVLTERPGTGLLLDIAHIDSVLKKDFVQSLQGTDEPGCFLTDSPPCPTAAGTNVMSTYIQRTLSDSNARDALFIDKLGTDTLPVFDLCARDAWAHMCDEHASCTWNVTVQATATAPQLLAGGHDLTCTCDRPYSGAGYEDGCINFGQCFWSPCFSAGSDITVDCFESIDAGKGFYCGDCPPGYAGNGEICGNRNACMLRPCFPGVQCYDHPAPSLGYTCGACPPGFHASGDTCRPSPHNSRVEEINVPRVVFPGQAFTVSVTLENTGSSRWRASDDYYLASEFGMPRSCELQLQTGASHCDFMEGVASWGANKIELAHDVQSGQFFTVQAEFTAPMEDGIYDMSWQMVADGTEWFGAQTATKFVVEGPSGHPLVEDVDYDSACGGANGDFCCATDGGDLCCTTGSATAGAARNYVLMYPSMISLINVTWPFSVGYTVKVSASRIGQDDFETIFDGEGDTVIRSAPAKYAKRIQIQAITELNSSNVLNENVSASVFCGEPSEHFGVEIVGAKGMVFAQWSKQTHLEIPLISNFDHPYDVKYKEVNSVTKPFDRIAYHVQLDHDFVLTSMNAFTLDPLRTGIPVNDMISVKLEELNAVSNIEGISLDEAVDGRLEFWGHCYQMGDDGRFDVNDAPSDTDCPSLPNCYGSMQVHTNDRTIFAYNGWTSANHWGASDLGIGTNPDTEGHPDWTFSQNALQYGKRDIEVYVRTTSIWRAPDSTELASYEASSDEGNKHLAYDDSTNSAWQPTLLAADNPACLNVGQACAYLDIRLKVKSKITGAMVLAKAQFAPDKLNIEYYDDMLGVWKNHSSWALTDTNSWQELTFSDGDGHSVLWRAVLTHPTRDMLIIKEIRFADDREHQNLALFRSYALDTRAAYNGRPEADEYIDFGGGQLTNGDVTEETGFGVGFFRRNAEVTVDLDSSFCLSKVLVCVGLGGNGMIVPKSVDVQLSDDGTEFYPAGFNDNIHQAISTGVQWIEVPLSGLSGRFVRINVERDGPAGGVWIMLSEVQVIGCSGGTVDQAHDTYGFAGDMWLDLPLNSISTNQDMSLRLDVPDSFTIEFYFQLSVPMSPSSGIQYLVSGRGRPSDEGCTNSYWFVSLNDVGRTGSLNLVRSTLQTCDEASQVGTYADEVTFRSNQTAWNMGEWYHIVFVNKGTGLGMKLIINDGEAVDEETGGVGGLGELYELRLANAIKPIAGADLPELSFTGLVHSLRIWSSALPHPVILQAPVSDGSTELDSVDRMFDGDSRTSWDGATIGPLDSGAPAIPTGRTRTIFEYPSPVAPTGISIRAPYIDDCSPESGYTPPTDFRFEGSNDGTNWVLLQQYSSRANPPDFGFCCSISSVSNGEPGCSVVTPGEVRGQESRPADLIEMPLDSVSLTAYQYLSLDITRVLGDSWAGTVGDSGLCNERDCLQPSIAEVQIEHVANVTLVQSNIPAYLHMHGATDNPQYATVSNDAFPARLGLEQFTIAAQFRRDGDGTTTGTDEDATRTTTTASGGTTGVTLEPIVAKGRHDTTGRDGTNADINYCLGVCTTDAGDKVVCIDVEESNGGANYGVVGTEPLTLGVWYIAVATYDGVHLKLYLNGELQGSVRNLNGVRSDATSDTTFGTAVDSTGAADGFFNGGIGYVAFWNHAVTSLEILHSTTEYAPIAEFGFNEGGGTVLSSSTRIIYDDNGPSLEATIVGVAGWFRISDAIGGVNAEFKTNADTRYQLYVNGVEARAYDDTEDTSGVSTDTTAYTASCDASTTFAFRVANDGPIEINSGRPTAGLLASTDYCGQTISTSAKWKCVDYSTVSGDAWQDPDFDDSAWPAAFVLGPTGMIPWSEPLPEQGGYWIWTDPSDDATEIACRYTRVSHAGEYDGFKSTRWDWRKLGVSERRCESWRCGIVAPLFEVAHDLPPGSQVHVSSLAAHEGDYDLDGLCFIRTNTNVEELMRSQLVYPLEGCYQLEEGESCTNNARRATALRSTSMVSDRFDLWEPTTADCAAEFGVEEFLCKSWISRQGGTPSGSTGPPADHTTAAGYYMYAEADSGYPDQNNPARYLMATPKLRYSKIGYWFSMYGSGSAQMGQLHIDLIQGDTVILDVVAPKIGDQGQQWVYDEIDLSGIAAAVQIRFRAEVGSGYRSDIALDDITLHIAEPIGDAPIVTMPEQAFVDQGVGQVAEIPMSVFNQGRDVGMLDIRGFFSGDGDNYFGEFSVDGRGEDRVVSVGINDLSSGEGLYTIEVDNGRIVTSATVNIIINVANQAPELTAISDQKLAQSTRFGDSSTQVSFLVTDHESRANVVPTTVTAENPALFAEDGLVLSGSGSQRQLTITAGKPTFPFGVEELTTLVTITATDPGNRQATTSFAVTVSIVNDPPQVFGVSPSVESGCTADCTLEVYPDVWNTITFFITDTETQPIDIVVFAEAHVDGIGDTSVVAPENVRCEIDPTNSSRRLLHLMSSTQGFSTLAIVASDGYQSIPGAYLAVTSRLPPFSAAPNSVAEGQGTTNVYSGVNGTFVVTTFDETNSVKRVGGDTVIGTLSIDKDNNPRYPDYRFTQTTFQPVDTSTGFTFPTWSSSHEEMTEAIAIGFAFPFYGTDYTEIYVHGDGYVQFGSGTPYIADPQWLPYPDGGPLIAVYWEDYDKDLQGVIQTGNVMYNDQQAFVLEFDEILAFGREGSADWQLVLSIDGSFDMIFEHVMGDDGNHTIGFHNTTDGHMICRGIGTECTFTNTQFHVMGPVDDVPDIVFPCADLENGNYSCSYDVTNAGAYLLTVEINPQWGAAPIGNGDPFPVWVQPGPVVPEQCAVYGTGLFNGTAGSDRYLTLVSRDLWANDRYGIGDYSIDDSQDFKAIIFANDYLLTVVSNLVDPEASIYEFRNILTNSGRYSIQVLYLNMPIVDPQEFYVFPAATNPFNSTVSGRGTVLCTQYQESVVVVQARDIYGNSRESGGDDVAATLLGGQFPVQGTVTDNNDGTYDVAYVLSMMGTYSMVITIADANVVGSPFSVQNLDPNRNNPITSQTATFAFGDGLMSAVVGSLREFEIQAVSVNNRNQIRGGDNFTVVLVKAPDVNNDQQVRIDATVIDLVRERHTACPRTSAAILPKADAPVCGAAGNRAVHRAVRGRGRW